MKKLLAFLSSIPAFAYADLGDSRLTQRHYPSDWVVTHIYDKNGIAVVADYGKRDGWFTDQEITDILKSNGMEPGVWNYYSQHDGSLWNEDPRADGSDPRVGQFLLFRHYDLGVKSLTVGTQEGWSLAPRSFLEARLPMGHHLDP